MMSRKFLLSATFVFLILACASEKSEFHKAAQTNSIEAFEAFITKYPQGKLLSEATKKIHQLAYESAKAKDSLRTYLEFHQKYPETEFTAIVNERIAELEFQIVKEKDSLHVYRAYRAKYPESPFLGEIEERIEVLSYQLALRENKKAVYQNFLKEFPDSKYASNIKKMNQEFPSFMFLTTQTVAEVNSSMLGQTWSPNNTSSTKGLIVLVKTEVSPNHTLIPKDDFVLSFERAAQVKEVNCDGFFQSPSIETSGNWIFFASGLSLKIHISEPTTMYLNLLFAIPVDVNSISIFYKKQPIAMNVAIKK